jgi:serine/threonine-protein kinase
VGRSASAAKAALARVDLGTKVTRAYDATAPKGQVTTQDPKGGQLPVGSTVTITVSKGPHLYDVPDVTGESVEQARRVLADAGFQARVIGGSHQVIQQIPGAGAKERRGTTVTLLASLF